MWADNGPGCLTPVKFWCLRLRPRRALAPVPAAGQSLVEFETEHVPGLIGLLQMQDELAALTGRPVDLLTPRFLHRQIRQRVLNEARVIYDAA